MPIDSDNKYAYDRYLYPVKKNNTKFALKYFNKIAFMCLKKSVLSAWVYTSLKASCRYLKDI